MRKLPPKDDLQKRRGYHHAVFLTFDTDWACNEILEETLGFLIEEEVPSTIFVTDHTPFLDVLRKCEFIEVGAHPDFNKILKGEEGTVDVASVVREIRKIVPDAVSIRSHSLVQSSRLMELFLSQGFTHDVNLFIPAYSGMDLYPYHHPNGILRVPFFWEDDLYCTALDNRYDRENDVAFLLKRPGLKVFSFHPIHLFLNTENLRRYEESRPFHRIPSRLKEYKLESEHKGTSVFLRKVISEARDMGMVFRKIRDIGCGRDGEGKC